MQRQDQIALRNAAIRAMPDRRMLASVGWRLPLLMAAVSLGVIGRVAYSWHAPLWFDETFSAVIATQPNFARLVDWCLNELTGPAFYMPLWLWVKVAGSSDMALRLPSLILSIVAPLAILWKGHPDRDTRLWWAVFALLWVPIFGVAGEARPYPQMFLLGAFQAMAFMRLLAAPTTARAAIWVTASVLLVLTHYWGALPCLVQGVAYLAYHRGRAMRTWPAGLLLLPLLGWAYVHLPLVAKVTDSGAAAYRGLPLSALADIPAMVLGIAFNANVILGVVAGSTMLVFWRTRFRRLPLDPARVLALCGVISIVLILIFAFSRAGFAPRYATPAMPSFLFALALWARWMQARDARPVIVVAAMLLSSACGLIYSILTEPDGDARHLFNLEQPSAWLAERHPAQLVMFWDGPIGAITPASRLEEIGGFFLRRSGTPLTVKVARATANQDPNNAVLALAGGDSAILWTANDSLPKERTPAIERYDARFECRDFGGGQLTMTACRRRP